MNKPSNVCLTCKWAEWEKRADGRLHPSGDGLCAYPRQQTKMPAAKTLHSYWVGGRINRTKRTYTDCPTWEKAL